MTAEKDILGTFALIEKIESLQSTLENLVEDKDPLSNMIREQEFCKRVGISASTLRHHRYNGNLKYSWRKLGKHIFWNPRLFWKEMGENQNDVSTIVDPIPANP